jgi:hypothetical protein
MATFVVIHSSLLEISYYDQLCTTMAEELNAVIVSIE